MTADTVNDSDNVIGGFTVVEDKVKQPISKVALLAGSKSFSKEEADLFDSSDNYSSKVDIVVATPGRLIDHIYNSTHLNLQRLRMLVIDEADRVLTEEKQDWYQALDYALYHHNHHHLSSINLDASSTDATTISQRSKSTSSLRRRPVASIEHAYDTSHDVTLQKILVSATLTHDPEPLKRFNLYFPKLFTSRRAVRKAPAAINAKPVDANKARNSCKNKEAESTPLPSPTQSTNEPSDQFDTHVGVFTTPIGLKEFIVNVPLQHRAPFIVHLLRGPAKIERLLCFTNSRLTANRLHTLLSHFDNINPALLSGQVPLGKRRRIVRAFVAGRTNVLVCTDAMARGIDIDNVDCVVSYEMPPSVKTYVHRIGRTARAGKAGLAYTLLLREQFFHFKKDLRKVGKTSIKEAPFHISHISSMKTEYENALKALETSVVTDHASQPSTAKSFAQKRKRSSSGGEGDEVEDVSRNDQHQSRPSKRSKLFSSSN